MVIIDLEGGVGSKSQSLQTSQQSCGPGPEAPPPAKQPSLVSDNVMMWPILLEREYEKYQLLI